MVSCGLCPKAHITIVSQEVYHQKHMNWEQLLKQHQQPSYYLQCLAFNKKNVRNYMQKPGNPSLYSRKKIQSTEADSEQNQMLDLINKIFKVANMSMFKEINYDCQIIDRKYCVNDYYGLNVCVSPKMPMLKL